MVDTILVVGATGFTGRLVAEYLANHPERSSYNLHLGARSPSKLAALIAELDLKEVIPVEIDVTREDSVEKAVLGATVVLNCVGPFYIWGTNVLRAAARHGRHYVDITGEGWWILDMIEKYDYLAYKNGSTIVPASALDSIPSDISAFLSAQTLKSLIGPNAQAGKSVTAHSVSGMMSGGTFATVHSAFALVPKALMAKSARPFSLSPSIGPTPSFPRLVYTLPHYTKKRIQGGFFIMSLINEQVVRRSWGLLKVRSPELAYGDNFDYTEFMVTQNAFVAAAMTLGLLLGSVLLLFPPFRWVFSKIIPSPGTGLSAAEREKGRYIGTNITSSIPSAGEKVRHVKTVIKGYGDPGYNLGAVMVAESAIALLPINRDSLTALGREGGILTPMTAFGNTLVDRLRKSGKFEVESGELIDGGRTEPKKLK